MPDDKTSNVHAQTLVLSHDAEAGIERAYLQRLIKKYELKYSARLRDLFHTIVNTCLAVSAGGLACASMRTHSISVTMRAISLAVNRSETIVAS